LAGAELYRGSGSIRPITASADQTTVNIVNIMNIAERMGRAVTVCIVLDVSFPPELLVLGLPKIDTGGLLGNINRGHSLEGLEVNHLNSSRVGSNTFH
jgi:hypothetical protein